MERIASFGYWLRRRRKALDLTQAELAWRAGCSEGMIRMIEADERRPSRHLAARLADRLGLAAEEREDFVKAARAERAVDRLDLAEQPAQAPSPDPARATVPPELLIGHAQDDAALEALMRHVADVLTTYLRQNRLE